MNKKIADLEEYFYRYFSIPQYDELESSFRLSKEEWLRMYKEEISNLLTQKP